MTEPTPPTRDEDFDTRLRLFNQELMALQQKYHFNIVAQVLFPGGAVLNVPVTATPLERLGVRPPTDQIKTD